MPARSVDHQQGYCSRGGALADFRQVLVHGVNAGGRQDQSGASAPGRAGGAGEISPVEAPVPKRAWTAAAPYPDAGQRALLPNPCFIPRFHGGRPETGFRPVCRRRVYRALPWLSERRFFKGFLGFKIGLGMLRANRKAAAPKPSQEFAHAASVQGNHEPGCDAVSPVNAPEAHGAVAGQACPAAKAGIGAFLNPRCGLARPGRGWRDARCEPGRPRPSRPASL